MFLTLP
ncbi:unnamed protein product [Callosobruchus maculatus]|nr:unnamed protein product [Callosobruchus maculatus]